MAVAFDAVGTAVIGSSSASVDDTSLTVGSGSGRALTVVIAMTTAVAPTVTATWDQGGSNQAMTSVVVRDDSGTISRYLQIFGLLNPVAGTKTLRVTGLNVGLGDFVGVSWTGVDQSSVVAAFTNGTTASGSSTTASVTISSAVGNAIIAIHIAAGDVPTAVNNTQIFLDTTSANAGSNRANGAGSVAMTMSINSSVNWRSAGISINAIPPAIALPLPQVWM